MRLRDDLAVIVLLTVLAVLALWLWLGWAADRDERGMARIETAEEISDSSRGFDDPEPYKPSGYNLGPDTGWPADWPTRHQIGLIAWGQHLDHLDQVEASSMTLERQADGEIVVTNPPEAPVAPGGDAWEALRQCESSGRWDVVSRNGLYFGAYQFHRPTWDGVVVRAGLGEWAGRSPAEAPPEVQHAAAVQLHSERGWQPWPGCRRALGLG